MGGAKESKTDPGVNVCDMVQPTDNVDGVLQMLADVESRRGKNSAILLMPRSLYPLCCCNCFANTSISSELRSWMTLNTKYITCEL